jgi:hypothetical protein
MCRPRFRPGAVSRDARVSPGQLIPGRLGDELGSVVAGAVDRRVTGRATRSSAGAGTKSLARAPVSSFVGSSQASHAAGGRMAGRRSWIGPNCLVDRRDPAAGPRPTT